MAQPRSQLVSLDDVPFTISQAVALEEATYVALISLTVKATSTGVIALLACSCTAH